MFCHPQWPGSKWPTRTIPNTAASIVGGGVALNLSHAFETAMAAYGLGRIISNHKAAGVESGSSTQHGRSLSASLEAGDRAPPLTALARRQPIRRSRCPPAFARPPRPVQVVTKRPSRLTFTNGGFEWKPEAARSHRWRLAADPTQPRWPRASRSVLHMSST